MAKPGKPERWKGTRTVEAPPPLGPGAVNRILGVILAEGERVRLQLNSGVRPRRHVQLSGRAP